MNTDTCILILLISGIFFGCICLWIAKEKGRDPIMLYFLLGFFLGVLGLIITLIVPRTDKAKQSEKRK